MNYQSIFNAMPTVFTEEMLSLELKKQGGNSTELRAIKKQASFTFMNLGIYPSCWDKNQSPKPISVRNTFYGNRGNK